MTSLKLRKVGDSIEATIPADLLARLQVGAGDTLQVVETPDGVLLQPVAPDFQRQLNVARTLMKENKAVLSALAK